MVQSNPSSGATHTDKDVEGQRRQKIPFWKLIADQGVVTSDIVEHKYSGSGTLEDPYVCGHAPHPTIILKSRVY